MDNAPHVEVTIETPRGSFVKRKSSGEVDYVSPIPCPFNYGSVRSFAGRDGDPLDAGVLGRRLRKGTCVKVRVIGAVRMIDRGLVDDKLICSERPVGRVKRSSILLFFHILAVSKLILNLCRGHTGGNRCIGWRSALEAMERCGTHPTAGEKRELP